MIKLFDINNDGIIDIEDITSTISFYRGFLTPKNEQLKQLDLNNDNIVDIEEINNVISSYRNVLSFVQYETFKFEIDTDNKQLIVKMNTENLETDVSGVQLYVIGVNLVKNTEVINKSTLLNNWIVAGNVIDEQKLLSLVYFEIDDLNDKIKKNQGMIELARFDYDVIYSFVRAYSVDPYRSYLVDVSENDVIEYEFKQS